MEMFYQKNMNFLYTLMPPGTIKKKKKYLCDRLYSGSVSGELVLKLTNFKLFS